MNAQMQENLNPMGLSLSQFAILMTLLEDEGLTQVEISKRVMLPGYATSRNLDRLESLGYVKRHSHETSRRALRVMLTEKGRVLAPDLYRVTQGLNERFLAPLKENQKAEFLNSLALLAEKFSLSSKN
jgi:DNA-binding MarR family transcriptional regulator